MKNESNGKRKNWISRLIQEKPPSLEETVKLLQIQAEKRGGKLRGGFLKKSIKTAYLYLGVTHVYFPHGNFNIQVIPVIYEGEPPMVYINSNFRLKEKLKFTMYYKNKLLLTARSQYQGFTFGVKKIKVDNSNFNEIFIIKSNNESFTTLLLNYDIQNRLLDLANNNYNPMIKITKNVFTFASQSILYKEEEYDKIIDFCLLFLDKFRNFGLIEHTIQN